MTQPGYDFVVEYKYLPETPVEGKPLGRHVRHDSRSKLFAAAESDPATLVHVDWTDHIGLLDQGNVGSCTGNATVGAVGSTPFFEALQAANVVVTLDEALAVAIYSRATQLDGYSGTYPPDDTGSDGLSAAKAAQEKGLISGYQHALSLNAALTALQTGPVITGVEWYSGFDSPASDGFVSVSGSVRGGHEFVIVGNGTAAEFGLTSVAGSTRVVKARNSWGTGFGVGGYFFFSEADWQTLLNNQGDVTIFVPVTAPAPTPTPVPTPTPTPVPTPTPTPTPGPTPDAADVALWSKERLWANGRHITGNKTAATNLKIWAKLKGFI